MKLIAMIAGPALGHVARLQQVALQLREMVDCRIVFIGPRLHGYLNGVVGEDFEAITIPIAEENMKHPYMEFSAGLENVLESYGFDLIVHDMNPVRWLATMRFPDCPRINVTNVFLTKLSRTQTSQERLFSLEDMGISKARAEKNLSEINSVYDLYEADRVLLADPTSVISIYGDLPANYIACGPSSWSKDGELPIELSKLENVITLSMGSTGKNVISKTMLVELKESTGSQVVIYAGSQFEEMDERDDVDHAYEWLPLNRMLERTRLVVSQGGAGSTYQALSYGIPVVVSPTHRNQEILGEILEDIGVGVCINSDASMAKIKNVDIEELTDNALLLSDEIANQNGAHTIAQQISGLL